MTKGDDSVLLGDHTVDVWDSRNTGDYSIDSFPGKAQVRVVTSTGRDHTYLQCEISITCRPGNFRTAKL